MLRLPPITVAELMRRVDEIAGQTLGELAHRLGQSVPDNLLHHKGWVGQLLEQQLGTDAGNRAVPDFTHLDIELKTIPVNAHGQPQESTYVSVVPLLGYPALCWQNSEVRAKLKRVLWVPIEDNTIQSIANRRIGQAILWDMPAHIEAILRVDWQELMEYVLLGRLAEVNGRMGQYLHIRPKAANSKALTYGLGPDGEKYLTLPRGFYLRTQLTEHILRQSLDLD